MRTWKEIKHEVPIEESGTTVNLKLRAKCAPPPIGTMEWPAGRILLQWAVDGGIPLVGATVLEIGAGIGTTSVGLALASEKIGATRGLRPTRVFATDICKESLDNLASNAEMNGVQNISVLPWDGASGHLLSLPFDPRELTHVIGADVQYHGFNGKDANEAEDQRGLARTIEELLKVNPSLSGNITLVLVDRFSGAAFSAMSQVAGISPDAPAVPIGIDPALASFIGDCERFGLVATREALHPDVELRVAAGQSWIQRLTWMFCQYHEGMKVYRIGLAK